MRRPFKHKKAISPVVAELFLIVLVVVTFIFVAAWIGIMTYSFTGKIELLTVENHTWTTSSRPTTEVIRAAQVFPYDPIREEFISEIKTAGVNTILYEVFGRKGVDFNTAHAPVLNDLLNSTVKIAHDNGIKVYAWMTTLNLEWVLQEHPEWAVVAYDYEKDEYVVGGGYYRVSPFVPEFIDYLKDLYTDLAGYDIDGIMFQDDLILGWNEDFSTYANGSYYADFNRNLNPLDMYDFSNWGVQTQIGWEWIRWKSVKLMVLTKEIMDAVHEVNPKVKFVLDAYSGTTYAPEDYVTWFGQNITLAVEYNFDYVAIMSYQHGLAKAYNLTADETFLLVKNITENAVSMTGDASKVIIKIQTRDHDTLEVLPAEEIEKTLKAILSAGHPEVGIAYFAHQSNLPFETIRESWERSSFTSDGIKLYVRNTGTTTLTLDYVVVNREVFTNATFTTYTLEPGNLSEIYIQWPYVSGTIYQFTVITQTGTKIPYTTTAP